MNRRTALKIAGGAIVVGAASVLGASQLGVFKPRPTQQGTTQTTIKRGGTLTIAIDADIVNLDPHASTAAVDRVLYQAIYSHFVDLDANLNLIPAVAEKWTQPDNKTYIFNIRDGVMFHDGTKVDADAVKFNFDRMMGLLDKSLLPIPNLRQTEVSPIDKVEVIDSLTVKISLKSVFAPFLSVLADRAGMFVSPTTLKKDPQGFVQNPVGAGPFKFVEWKKDDHVAAERFPNYYQKDLPYLDRVIIVPRIDTSKRLQDLRSGTVDFIRYFATSDIDTVKKEAAAGNIFYRVDPSLQFQGYFLNNSKPPFDNKLLRQAVRYAVDLEELVNTVYFGVDKIIYGPLTAAHNPYYDPDFKPYPKWPKADLDSAKQALAKAGVPNGFEFELKTVPAPSNRQEAELIQSQLQKVGIKVNVVQVDFTRILADGAGGTFQMIGIGWSGRPDLDQNMYQFWHTNAPNNYARYNNPDVDKGLDDARTTTATDDRVKLYRDAVSRIADDVPYLFTRSPSNTYAWRKGVSGFIPVPDSMVRPGTMYLSS